MKLGPPAEGEVVQVKWPDGKLYGAKYLGSNVAHMYQVSAALGVSLLRWTREARGQMVYLVCYGSRSYMNLEHLLFYKKGKVSKTDDPDNRVLFWE